jgi:LysM repeat protein
MCFNPIKRGKIMAESKNSLINQVLDSFARDLGFTSRLSQMGGNLKNTFKTMRSTLNDMSLDGVRKFANENIQGGKGVSSAAAAERKVKNAVPNVRSGVKTGGIGFRGESRADIKARVKGKTAINPSRSGAKTGTTKTIKVKSGDTLSAIARKNNTTVAALMRMNPKIENKNEIRIGQFINVGSPTRAAAKTKSSKSLRGEATSVAEAKRRGMSEYRDTKTGKMKAAVTADELKKSGLSLRAYLNKMKKKKK